VSITDRVSDHHHDQKCQQPAYQCSPWLHQLTTTCRELYDILIKCFRCTIVPKCASLVFVKICRINRKNRVTIALSRHPSVIHTSIFPCRDQEARLEKPRQSQVLYLCHVQEGWHLVICSIAHIPRAQLFSHVQRNHYHLSYFMHSEAESTVPLQRTCPNTTVKKQGNQVNKNLGYSSPAIWPQKICMAMPAPTSQILTYLHQQRWGELWKIT